MIYTWGKSRVCKTFKNKNTCFTAYIALKCKRFWNFIEWQMKFKRYK